MADDNFNSAAVPRIHEDFPKRLPANPHLPNLEQYLPEIEDQFVSEEAAMEFLRTLWNIMTAFVDLGWGVDSIHFAFPELLENSSGESEDGLGSSDQHIEDKFKAAANGPPEREIP